MAIRKFQRSAFGRKSPVYSCRVCDRRTRNTGDEGSIDLCLQCYELAGIENAISDNGEGERAVYAEEIARHLAALTGHGIDVAAVWPDFAEPAAPAAPAWPPVWAWA